MIEIVLRGRGGQGVVTAGELLVKAAVSENKYGQSIPFFGGERRGAPVVSYVRLSDSKITIHRNVYNPEIVAVFDSSLFNVMDPLEGLIPNGIVVLNASTKHESLSNAYYIDANRIAKELGLVIAGWPVVNTIMMGAVAKITKLITPDALAKAIDETFEGKIAEVNKEGAERGFNEVSTLG
ncbi:MAG: 2-oxoacid:acceptor oxidoreductase family protein [Candidatus Micrarchaeaceae archaeon]